MLRVLVADDEFDARDNMIAMIQWEENGMTVVAAEDNGLSAYEAILDLQPDIVLIDIQMRGMNGLDVIEKVRAVDGPQPVFIIISGYDDFAYAQRAIGLRVNGYLLKPFRPADVLSILKKHFGETSASQQICQKYPGLGASLLDLSTSGEDMTRYPVQMANKVISAMLQGTSEDVRQAIAQYAKALEDMRLSTPGTVNCYLILYAEIRRHLSHRETAVQPCEVEWDDSAPARSMRRLLTSMALSVRREMGQTKAKGSAPAMRAKAYIDENYAAPLSLEGVARHVAVTPTYLSSCFARDMGMGFVEYIKSVRVAHAKRMLIHSDLSVDEVSAACGYQDTKYFKQVFKQLTGMSPHAYRQQTPVL